MNSLVSEFGLTPAQARAVFGSVRAVVEADGPAKPGGARLLEVAAMALELTQPVEREASPHAGRRPSTGDFHGREDNSE
jgi:hypothetical protein